MHPRLAALLLALASVSCAGAREGDLSPEVAKETMDAFQAGDFDRVVELTEGIGEGSRWRQVRGNALQRRGEERFFAADIAGSIADFDAFLAIYPDRDPHHWQRGLSYYYAEEYEKGKAQFERHQTVNTQDVENAVWHFLCAVRAPGGSVEAARAELIPIERDSRVPMKQVHDLFAGRGGPEAVLEAAAPERADAPTERERSQLCYAHLYLALYYEALGEEETSAEHIRKAAFDFAMDHYMGRTAQVHAKMRGVGPPP